MSSRFYKITIASLAFFAFLALLAVSTSGAPGELPEGYGERWLGSVAALLSVILALVFIVLGVAKLLNLRSLEFATKDEMFQVLVSLAIASFVFAGGLDWVLGFLGGKRLYTEAMEFIDGTWKKALKIYVETVVIRGIAGLLASVEIGGEAGIVIAGISLSLSPFAFLKPVAILLERIGWFFILALFSLKVHGVLLWFGHDLALKVLLGPGVLLRAFKVTRVAGAFLIGLALSLYLVFPAVVVGVYKASYDESKADLAEETSEKVREELENYKRDVFTLSWDLGSLLAKIAALPYALYTLLRVFIDVLFAYMEELILLFMILPLITMGVLAATIYAVTESLGGRSNVLRRFIGRVA
jgi:hypothetical protein